MLSWRIRRQLAVFLIVILPLAAVGYFLALKIIPEASCTDGRKSQGESGIDCGGPCVPCELKTPKNVEVFWARAVRVKENLYDLVAFIRSPNEILVSQNLQYEFSLFDRFGLVARRTGKTFLLAEEGLHIVEPAVETKRLPTRVDFKIVGVRWELKKIEQPNLIVEKKDYRVVEDNGRKYSVVEASIFNRSLFNLREVEVFFTLTDEKGNILGANKVLVENLSSASSKVVKSIWPEELKGEISNIEIEPRVNVFDPTIIL